MLAIVIAICVPQMQEVSVEKREKVGSTKRKSSETQSGIEFQRILGAQDWNQSEMIIKLLYRLFAGISPASVDHLSINMMSQCGF